jgi:hypothetical protein
MTLNRRYNFRGHKFNKETENILKYNMTDNLRTA